MTRGPYRTKPDPGSFAALIRAFRLSPRYRDWSPGTAKHADRVLSDFMTLNGRQQVSALNRGAVLAMRDSLSETPGAANNWLKVIRILLDYAVDLEYVPHNVARSIPSLRPTRPGGHRTWREDEIAAFLTHWPLGSLPHLTLALALCTGAAAVDLVKLGWHSVETSNMVGRISYRRQKTERRKGPEETPLVDIPILPELAAALAALPRDRLTFLETARGASRSEGALAHRLRVWTAEAGLGAPDRNGRHLTLHGLRKALGRRLAEAGASPHSLMAVLGHESMKSVEVYTRAYDRARAADAGLEKMGGAKPSNVTRIKRRKD